jgi:hypothetical protein
MAKENTASGSGAKDVDDVEGLMVKLGLREEDLDDVVFEEQEGHSEETTRWLAVGKVHTESDFSHFWFFKNMRAAWGLAKDVKIKVIEDNLFVFQFACLGDWEKVMEGGPWVFRGKSVLMAPYDGFTKPSTIKLDTLLMWIQIHDLPVGYKNMVKTLASKVDDFESAEPPSNDYAGNFYRARVRVDVRKQLKRVVSIIRDSKRQLFYVKYERIPDWCAVCGYLGHTYKEHGDGIHSPDAMIFKGLKAEYSWRPSDRPNRGRGRVPGRGRSGGRGTFAFDGMAGVFDGSAKDQEEELDDANMEDADKNRKRGSTSEGQGMGTAPVATVPTNVGQLVNQFQSRTNDYTPPRPQTKRDPKRTRTEVEEGVLTKNNTTCSVLAAPSRSTARSNESPGVQLSRSGQCHDSEGSSRFGDQVCPLGAFSFRNSNRKKDSRKFSFFVWL